MLNRLYDLLAQLKDALGGRRLLADCTGRMEWPRQGVYLFFEPGELRPDGRPRVVRVGTHGLTKGSQTTLWHRLQQHKGSQDLRGNHRGSVFRLHIGAALMRRFPDMAVDTWGQGSSAPQEIRQREEELEKRVSRHMGDMSVLWLPEENQERRRYFERNLIGFLTGGGPETDPPSPGWLGRYSPKPEIRETGLWNNRHSGESADPGLLARLEEAIRRV